MMKKWVIAAGGLAVGIAILSKASRRLHHGKGGS